MLSTSNYRNVEKQNTIIDWTDKIEEKETSIKNERIVQTNNILQLGIKCWTDSITEM